MRWLLFGWGLSARLLSQNEITVLSQYRMICRQQHFAPLRRLKQVIKMQVVSDKTPATGYLFVILLALFRCFVFDSLVFRLRYHFELRSMASASARTGNKCPAFWPDLVFVVWQQPSYNDLHPSSYGGLFMFRPAMLLTLHVLFLLTPATLYRKQHSNLFFTSRSQ